MKIAVKVAVLIAFICLHVTSLVAGDKPTSFSDAQAAIDANLRTSEGKAFDERMGNDFVEKHMAPLRACKQAAGGDFTSF
jgi:predicted outer membrane protein